MNDQMLHLVFAADLPTISIRVIPASAGPHAGLAGPFMMLEQQRHNTVVCVEFEATSIFIGGEDRIKRYRDIWSRLADIALDEGESRSWLARRASAYDRPQGSHHAWPEDPVA
jgi:hypothetical protein